MHYGVPCGYIWRLTTLSIGLLRQPLPLLYSCIRTAFSLYFPSSQNATALAAATFRESTPWAMGIFTV